MMLVIYQEIVINTHLVHQKVLLGGNVRWTRTRIEDLGICIGQGESDDSLSNRERIVKSKYSRSIN